MHSTDTTFIPIMACVACINVHLFLLPLWYWSLSTLQISYLEKERKLINCLENINWICNINHFHWIYELTVIFINMRPCVPHTWTRYFAFLCEHFEAGVLIIERHNRNVYGQVCVCNGKVLILSLNWPKFNCVEWMKLVSVNGR